MGSIYGLKPSEINRSKLREIINGLKNACGTIDHVRTYIGNVRMMVKSPTAIKFFMLKKDQLKGIKSDLMDRIKVVEEVHKGWTELAKNDKLPWN